MASAAPSGKKFDRILETVGGALIVALLIWIASSVAGLKESAAAFVEWKVSKERQDQKQDERLDRLERGSVSSGGR